VNKERIKELIGQLLLEIGEDPQREDLKETPRRVADLYEEIFSGYTADPELDVTFAERNDVVVQKDIPFHSMCEHHLLPFFGKAHIAYQPSGRVIGISKLARLVDKYARRLQLQERMTNQIADELQKANIAGAMVVLEGEHLCLSMRGPRSDGQTVTSAIRGSFNDPLVRANALELMFSPQNDTRKVSQSLKALEMKSEEAKRLKIELRP
jgi:GTP cyclohydrolase I